MDIYRDMDLVLPPADIPPIGRVEVAKKRRSVAVNTTHLCSNITVLINSHIQQRFSLFLLIILNNSN